MKLGRPLALMTLTLAGCVAFSPVSLAQDKKNDQTPPPAAPARRAAQVDRIKTLSEELKLTDEQKEKLKPIVKEFAGKLRELRQDTALSRQDRTAKMREIQAEESKKIKTVLTKEQQEKYDKMRQQRTQQNPPGQRRRQNQQ